MLTMATATGRHHMQSDYGPTIAAMEATGKFKVLQHIGCRNEFPAQPPGADPLEGIIVDVETTGLSASDDDIIQLGMLRFTYDSKTYAIYGVGSTFERLRKPFKSIPPEITRLTGITNEQVADEHIAPDEISAFADSAKVFIAFNAEFDRKFCERLHPVFLELPWACALSEIGWADEGFDGLKLRYLMYQFGLFHDAHNALADCYAVIELLARRLPKSGALGLMALSEASRRKRVRIMAVGSEFAAKDNLKARGYKWHDGGNGDKFWWIDVEPEAVGAEIDYVNTHASNHKTQIFRNDVTAHSRFSARPFVLNAP